jgi:hypothetical protein
VEEAVLDGLVASIDVLLEVEEVTRGDCCKDDRQADEDEDDDESEAAFLMTVHC